MGSVCDDSVMDDATMELSGPNKPTNWNCPVARG